MKGNNAHLVNADELLSHHWWGEQEAVAGTAFPADFPHLAELESAHYKVQEDLDGADDEELLKTTSLSRSQISAVLTALEAL